VLATRLIPVVSAPAVETTSTRLASSAFGIDREAVTTELIDATLAASWICVVIAPAVVATAPTAAAA